MIIFSYIRNFISNIYKLIKVTASSNNIYWRFLASNRTNCSIDKQAKVYFNHTLDNVTIGRGTYIAQNSIIFNASIGKFCSIGPNLVCGWGIHPTTGISTSPAFYSTKKQVGFTYSKYDKVEEQKFTTIGNDVFIGMNVSIMDGVTIGDGAVIGAGAIVSKDIPPYAIAVGCPIRIIKYRFSNEIIDSLIKSKWWDQSDAGLRNVEQNFFNVENFLRTTRRNQN